MVEMESRRIHNVFKMDECTRCGKCFMDCPVMHLPLEVAKNEIMRLIHHQESEYVLKHCTSCFSCNLICPYDCKPYQLILENWNIQYNERGAPALYRFVVPTEKNNVWEMLRQLAPKIENDQIQLWMRTPPKENILLAGNYTHLMSFIISGSQLLDHFTVVDLLDHWECGAYPYQLGYLDLVEDIGKQCKHYFDEWGVKTIITSLDAVEHMLNYVHPQEMRIQFDQKVINFNRWLLDMIESRKIALPKKLDMRVTVHDNCYSKSGIVEGKTYWDLAREVISKTGCEIVEMEHNRDLALCCGFGAGCSWQTGHEFSIPFDMMITTETKFQEVIATGSDILVTYCTGCVYLLWAARELLDYDLKIFHHIELVRMAMGENIDVSLKRHEERAWDLIAIITIVMLKSMFQKNFKIKKLKFSKREKGKWGKKPYVGLRIFRFFFKSHLVRKIYRKIFRRLMERYQTPLEIISS
ncbi:MAG: (Fe-S)-binding protein [Candidatus Lokiarchaeota archaeon]|nr:(Fe-S)-binding protein [Candidatus Lokiarchaeota archaeon]